VKEVYTSAADGHIVGGGNIFRGTPQKSLSIDRHRPTTWHAFHRHQWAALQDALEKQASFLACKAPSNAPGRRPFIRRRAMLILKGPRLILPRHRTLFSTDTAAPLRAMEIKANSS